MERGGRRTLAPLRTTAAMHILLLLPAALAGAERSSRRGRPRIRLAQIRSWILMPMVMASVVARLLLHLLHH